MLKDLANATDAQQVAAVRPPMDCLLLSVLTPFQHKAPAIRRRLLRAWTWAQEPVTFIGQNVILPETWSILGKFC